MEIMLYELCEAIQSQDEEKKKEALRNASMYDIQIEVELLREAVDYLYDVINEASSSI